MRLPEAEVVFLNGKTAAFNERLSMRKRYERRRSEKRAGQIIFDTPFLKHCVHESKIKWTVIDEKKLHICKLINI